MQTSSFFLPTNVEIGKNYTRQLDSNVPITPKEYSTYRIGNSNYKTIVYEDITGGEYHEEKSTGIILAMGQMPGIFLELQPASSILELADSVEIELTVFGFSLPTFGGIFVAIFFSMGGLSAGVALAYVAKIISSRKS